MNKIILLIIFLVYELNGYSQLTFTKVRDTTWYVELKDGTIIYSKKLLVQYSFDEGDYLLLDHNKKIPMSEVLRYKSRYGEYIREKGPVESYRIENGGPRLFVYSRSFWYSDSTGSHRDSHYFFRKGTTGDMLAMSYKNLKDAMADNAASMRELEAYRSTVIIAGAAGATGLLLTIVGGVQSIRKNTGRLNANQPVRPAYPARPGQPMPPMTTQPEKATSPLLIVGPVIVLGAMITLFTGPGHMQKAIRIYNQ